MTDGDALLYANKKQQALHVFSWKKQTKQTENIYLHNKAKIHISAENMEKTLQMLIICFEGCKN